MLRVKKKKIINAFIILFKFDKVVIYWVKYYEVMTLLSERNANMSNAFEAHYNFGSKN